MWDKADLVLLSAGEGMFSAGDGLWYRDHMGWSWTFGPHGLFWLLLFILAITVLVVSFRLGTRDIRSRQRVTGSSARRQYESARDILDERYAHGELDRGEYLARKNQLP